MRDVGFVVWAAIVVIGMVASIVSSARKASVPVRPLAAGARPTASSIAVATPPQYGAPPSLPPVSAAPPLRRPETTRTSDHDFPMVRTAHKALFGDRATLRRAVIAAEVLGKPLALRDE